MKRGKKKDKIYKPRKTKSFKSLNWGTRNRLASTMRRMFGAEQQTKGS